MSLKTKTFNFIRKRFTNRLGETLLVAMVNGKSVSHTFSRLVPMPYLYQAPAWRTVVRHGLVLKLDISDMVDWYVYFGFYDKGYEFLISKVKLNDCILDIGANIGYVSLRLAQTAIYGTVTGFEPALHNFSKCKANIGLNNFPNLSVHNLGIGSNPGTLHLRSSDPHNRGMNKIEVDNNDSAQENEAVKITTVDAWIDETATSKVDLIKIDVEGYEMEILKGAENTISRFWPNLFLEVNHKYLSEFGSSSAQLFEWLSVRNYKICDVSGNPIVNSETLIKGQMDIYAVR